MTDVVRIALCENYAVLRSGLRRILDAEEDLQVVGEARTVKEAIALAADTLPDVFVMDLGLPDGSGITATAEVCHASPATRVLVLTVHDDVAYLRRAFDAGAVGYLVKEAADVQLVRAICQVAAGRRYVHPTLGAALLAPDATSARLGGLGGDFSDREMEVLQLIALGLTNAEIADRLYVSVRTIESNRARPPKTRRSHPCRTRPAGSRRGTVRRDVGEDSQRQGVVLADAAVLVLVQLVCGSGRLAPMGANGIRPSSQ